MLELSYIKNGVTLLKAFLMLELSYTKNGVTLLKPIFQLVLLGWVAQASLPQAD